MADSTDQTDQTTKSGSGTNSLLGLGGILAAILAKQGQGGGLTGTAAGTYPTQSPLTPEGQYLWNTLVGDMGKTGKGFNLNVGGTSLPVQDPMQRRLLSQLGNVSNTQRIGQGWQQGSQGLFGNLAQMLPFMDWSKLTGKGTSPGVTPSISSDSSGFPSAAGDNLMNTAGTGADTAVNLGDTAGDYDWSAIGSLFG